MNTSPVSNPDFFGKDNVSFFIGKVEDVNDPKRSGRCRVRCVGWHPKDDNSEDGIKTEDLPWAKVALPTTLAQQNRVGGKHGLLPGSWVIGLFLDGEEAQQPMVLNSFNFTAKTTEQNNRKSSEAKNGTIEEGGFKKENALMKDLKKNDGILTDGEQTQTTASSGDTSGDTTLDNSTDGECPIKESKNDKDRPEQRSRGQKGNPKGQKYDVTIADGKCGSTTGARDEIQALMKELFPPQSSRFIHNDIVFNAISGGRMNLNGLMNILAQQICGMLKSGIQTQKGFMEDTINRLKMGGIIRAIPDRDGPIREIAAFATSTADDFWNVAFNTMLQSLCSQVFSSLQGMNNSGEDADNENNSEETITKPETQIQNSVALCMTDSILNDIQLIVEDTISLADSANKQSIDRSLVEISNLTYMVNDVITQESNRTENSMTDNKNISMVNEQTEKADEGAKEDSQGGNEQGASEIFGLVSGFNEFLSLLLQFKFTTNMLVFNKAGLLTLAQSTLSIMSGESDLAGCNPERLFNTALGELGSIGGVSGGNSGGGSGSGKSSKKSKDVYQNMGFGGLPGPTQPSTRNNLCEEAKTPETPMSDGGATVYATSLPSSDLESARNFNQGIPNTVIITNPGRDYLNKTVNRSGVSDCKVSFPSIHISGYAGTPIPVVNRHTGSLVAILTNPIAWNMDIANPMVSVIPDDDNCMGVYSDEADTDTVLSTIVVDNTGFDYDENTTVSIIDSDTGEENGEARPIIRDGRIVEVEIINNGRGFISIPEIQINGSGLGAKAFAIMGVVSKKDNPKQIERYVHLTFCPGKNSTNLIPQGMPLS
jgi:hypothetical protein